MTANSSIQDLPSIEKSSVTSVNPDEEVQPKRGWRFYGTFASLCLVNLVCALDATILANALQIMADELKGTSIEAFWTATSFLLASTVFQPTFTQLSHILGRKPVLLVALALFTIGAIIGGWAKNFTVILVGRVIQGTGSAGILSLTSVIVTDLVSLRERGKWLGLISTQWAIGSIAGPISGGGFAQNVTWRWVFWINIPICAVAFVMIPVCLKLNFKPSPFISQVRRIDWVGSFLFISALTSFLIPISWGGIQFEWSSYHVIVPLILGVFGMMLFAFYAHYNPVHSEPLIHASLFRSRSAIIAFTGTVVHGMMVWAILFYLPFYFQVAKNTSPLRSGVDGLAMTLLVAPGSAITGVLITKTGRYRPLLFTGWFLATFGMGLMCFLKTPTGTGVWVVLMMILGIGLGILYPSLGFAIQASSTDEDLPWAAAMFAFFRSLGQTVGVAVGGTVFQNQMKQQLMRYPLYAPHASQLSRDAASLVQYVKSLPLGSEARNQLVEAYVDSLRIIWAVMCLLSGLVMLASWLGVRERGIDRVLVTEQGFRHHGAQRSIDSEKALRQEEQTTD